MAFLSMKGGGVLSLTEHWFNMISIQKLNKRIAAQILAKFKRVRILLSVLLLVPSSFYGISAQAAPEQFPLPAILFLLLNDSGSSSEPGLQGDYVLLAANDLGMHCADQDHQVFSILPPFNVVHAQVIKRGFSPVLMDDESIEVDYLATSSPNDPVGAGSINTGNTNSTGVFKSNFWESLSGVDNPVSFLTGNKTLGGEVYDVLYPSVLAGGEMLVPPANFSAECDPDPEIACPSILNLFEPLPLDLGIPVPEGNELAQGHLVVTQQAMPGPANLPQKFERFDQSIGFFTDFDFGSKLPDRNWFSADGIPVSPVDDSGRVNAYPLMKVRALDKSNQKALAALDVVLPVAAEADCQNCHADALDCADDRLPARIFSTQCNESGLQSMHSSEIMSLDSAPGANFEQKLYNAAKVNVLRLHDKKYGAFYTSAVKTPEGDLIPRICDPSNDPNKHCLDSRRSIQCSQCHYSPALDLTQWGPVDEPEQGANGRQQTRHRSMSNVIHAFHGSLPLFEGEDLFPVMPSPIGRDPEIAESVLQKTCYSCHPGKDTDCLRGAMAKADVVCQDCHGDLLQVGNDFTLRVQTDNPGDFILDGSLRVPWATEPGCQSCHTGDARTKNHPVDAVIADDGIRLLQAYIEDYLTVAGHSGSVKVATMNQSPNSRFAENQALNTKGDTVDVLYRLSTGHGGLACESCHNSTHAIWPTQNLLANDNVASIQLQGHAGTVIECDICHEGNLGVTLGGPHGLHPVGGGEFADGGHEEIAEDNANQCRSCHGNNGNGTILSRVASSRSFTIEECENGTLCPGDEQKPFQVNLAKGTQVTCTMCHENEL